MGYYRPNQSVLEALPSIIFVAVIGPTAVGKTTLINAAASSCPELHPVISTMSRLPRPGEEDGVDAHFRARQEMQVRVDDRSYVTAVVNTTGEIYATAPEDYPVDGTAVMPVLSSAIPMFRALPFKSFRSIFVLPPSWEIWRGRIQSHDLPPAEVEKRMQEAANSLRFVADNQETVFVLNDDLAQATRDFTQAALGGLPSADQDICRGLADSLLQKLSKNAVS